MTETEKKKVLKDAWTKRMELYAEGDKLHVEGDNLWAKGRLLYVEGSMLYAEGYKLYAEGYKLYAEGDKLWAEAVLLARGDTIMEWKNYSKECHLGTGEVFKF